MENAIVVNEIWKAYGDLQVLKGLSLHIPKGITMVILGRSGVGKSVLLRQILGIELPDKGYIEVHGQRISAMSESERYEAVKSMGMLFQGAALFDSMNVGENVAFYLRQHKKKLKEGEIQDMVKEALEMVNLNGAEGKMPSDLSGGMRKRAALARVIVYNPDIILYDEPTTGLDPITAGNINELILRTQEKCQATSIVVTHDLISALKVGNIIAFHHDGKIYFSGSKQEFMASEDPIIKAFLANAILPEQYWSHGGK